MPPLSSRAALAAAVLLAAAAAWGVYAVAPPPAADVSRGSEDAFATGLHRRELPPRQAPIRWTTDRATFRFRHLPIGPAFVEIAAAGHRETILVVSEGVVVGAIPAGVSTARLPLPESAAHSRDVQLQLTTFVAGDGRALGARLARVSVIPARRGGPGAGLLLVFVLPAIAAVLAGRVAGLSPAAALGVAIVLLALQAAVAWPNGVLHSPYADRYAVLATAAACVSAAFARFARTGWAFVGLLAACAVQGLLATSPVMVVSDAVFHANTLARVSAGDWFPVSVTQHHPPFRIPYGVSFYALLVPFLRAGVDAVDLVRGGAALAGIAASAALFATLARAYGPMAAGLGVVLLQCLPLVFDVGYSYGNLSNAFGQAATVGFFAWWARPSRPGPAGAVLGAALLAVAAVAHLSSLIVAVALVAALLSLRARAGEADRGRVAAAGIGLAVAAAYYARHAGLVLAQLPRLAEGGGHGESAGLLAAAVAQVTSATWGLGLPALALAWAGRPWRASTPETAGLDRDWTAWWIGAALLALPAVVSPLEVRYLYALTAPVAAAAGVGLVLLHGRGGAARALGWTLAALQAALAAATVAAGVFFRYRG
jgi:hypothetical protein